MNILNNQEAFAALQRGKNLLCRHIDGEFLELNQFPATVFALPDYEFCIDIEKIELAGFTFTKPCTLDELKDDQEIFVIDFSCSNIYYGPFNSKSEYVRDLIINGVVQRDSDNAANQLRAVHQVLGVKLGILLRPVEFTGTGIKKKNPAESKPDRKRTNKKEASTDPKLLEAEKDIVLDGINDSKTEFEIDSLCYDLEKHSFTPEQLKAIENAKDAKLAELAAIKAEAESEKHDLLDSTEGEEQTPELSVLCEAFIGEISNAKNKEDLDFIRRRINSNGALTEAENSELNTRLNEKTKSFDEIDSIETTQTNGKKHIEEEEGKYQKKLAELKKRVDESKTVTEVNAVTKYTNQWSAKQREPLLHYIHKRLEELKKEKQANEPSLLVKIQTAPDIATLDILEVDIHSLEPLAQPKMMQAIKTRKQELEEVNTDSLIDEDLP